MRDVMTDSMSESEPSLNEACAAARASSRAAVGSWVPRGGRAVVPGAGGLLILLIALHVVQGAAGHALFAVAGPLLIGVSAGIVVWESRLPRGRRWPVAAGLYVALVALLELDGRGVTREDPLALHAVELIGTILAVVGVAASAAVHRRRPPHRG